jgi:hypothetical protein
MNQSAKPHQNLMKDTQQRSGHQTGIKGEEQYELSRFAYDATSIHFYAFQYFGRGFR